MQGRTAFACVLKLCNFSIVGAGALDSPLEGARFELSRAHVENIMWITQMRLQTKCRRGGTSGAPSPTSVIGQFFVLSYNGCNRGLVSSTGERCSPLQICCRNFVRSIYIQLSSYIRGVTLGIKPLVAYTQNTTMHTHALTQVLYSLFQNLSSYSLSRRACTCPQVSKRFLLIHEKHLFCCIKNATIAEMLPN